jgi:hypothetical protein
MSEFTEEFTDDLVTITPEAEEASPSPAASFTVDEFDDNAEILQPAVVTPEVEDADVNLEEPTEDLLGTSPEGIEEITVPDLVDLAETDDAGINDGFPEKTHTQEMNGSTPTAEIPTPITTPVDDGFEEIVAPTPVTHVEDIQVSVPEKKDDSLKSPLALWMMKQNLPPQVVRLIYWVELQRTCGVFGGILFLFLSLRYYSVIGVVTTFALSLLVVAFLYRIGMTIVKAVQKTSAEHPFKHLLEEKIEIPEECTLKLANKVRCYINCSIRELQALFLVKDTVASLKAMVMFWLVSYIASCINFLTICTLGTIAVFTLPKLYEEKQAEIDQLYTLAMSKTCMVCGLIEDKLPEKIKVYLKKDKKD